MIPSGIIPILRRRQAFSTRWMGNRIGQRHKSIDRKVFGTRGRLDLGGRKQRRDVGDKRPQACHNVSAAAQAPPRSLPRAARARMAPARHAEQCGPPRR